MSAAGVVRPVGAGRRRFARGAAAVLAGAAAAAVASAGPAAAEGPTGGAGSPSNGKYTAWVQVSGSGVGRGGSLAGPPVSSGGGGRVTVPSPCGYEKGETQASVEKAYLDANGGDVAAAKQALLQQANKLDTLASYTLPDSTMKARLQYENWGKPGVWYDSLCDASVSDAEYVAYVNNIAPPVLVNGGPPPVPQLIPDLQLLNDIAVRAMTLPDPAVQLVNPRTVVQLGTYVWVRPDDTRQRVVTAAVPGAAVTVTASAQSTWFTSTGAPTASCGLVTTESPQCSLLYAQSSGLQPGQQFTIVGHVAWTAVSSAGFPVPGAQMDSPAQGITVLEVQTVNGGSRWTR